MTTKRKTFHANDFLTRAERIAKIEVPESTKRRVIVKPNNQGIGFRFNCYSKEYLSPEIDKAQFDKTVMLCHKICENTYLQKKVEEGAEFNASSKKILGAGVIFVLTALILLIIRVYGSNNDDLLVAAVALIAITVVSTVLVVIKMYLTAPKFIDVAEVTKSRLKAAIENENHTIYKPKGFEWKMESNYYWLELHNLKENRDFAVGFVRQIRMNTENEPLNENLQTE